MFGKYGISTALKPHQTLRQLLVAPKDKTKTEDKSGVVYRVPCDTCDKVYVGETKRTLGERLKEYCAKTASNQSALAEHSTLTGHTPKLEDVKVLRREDKFMHRKVREAICIKQETSPTLNRDGGRDISRIFDSLLVTSTAPSSTNIIRRGSESSNRPYSRNSASNR